jgi:predicted transcriptional regulator
MRKTLTIQIKPLSDLFGDFRAAFKAAEHGGTIKRREGVYFTSIEAARNFLTRERLALLRTIRTRHPRSIYDLARIVDRDLKNVQQDVALLERHRLVRFTEKRRGPKSKIKVPEAPFAEIALKIAI